MKINNPNHLTNFFKYFVNLPYFFNFTIHSIIFIYFYFLWLRVFFINRLCFFKIIINVYDYAFIINKRIYRKSRYYVILSSAIFILLIKMRLVINLSFIISFIFNSFETNKLDRKVKSKNLCIIWIMSRMLKIGKRILINTIFHTISFINILNIKIKGIFDKIFQMIKNKIF
jgi:hypothetical protein